MGKDFQELTRGEKEGRFPRYLTGEVRAERIYGELGLQAKGKGREGEGRREKTQQVSMFVKPQALWEDLTSRSHNHRKVIGNGSFARGIQSADGDVVGGVALEMVDVGAELTIHAKHLPFVHLKLRVLREVNFVALKDTGKCSSVESKEGVRTIRESPSTDRLQLDYLWISSVLK